MHFSFHVTFQRWNSNNNLQNSQIFTAANGGVKTFVLQSVNFSLSVELTHTTTELTGEILTANQTEATCQWVDCDNWNGAIAWEINTTYSPTLVKGNYAVDITVNNCTETSACTLVDFTWLNEPNIKSSVFFPNPVLDLFKIKNIEQFNFINGYKWKSSERDFCKYYINKYWKFRFKHLLFKNWKRIWWNNRFSYKKIIEKKAPPKWEMLFFQCDPINVL